MFILIFQQFLFRCIPSKINQSKTHIQFVAKPSLDNNINVENAHSVVEVEIKKKKLKE